MSNYYKLRYIVYLCLLIPVNILLCQVFERPYTEIPDYYLNYLQNNYRKVINLNGTWNFSNAKRTINRSVKVPSCYDFKDETHYSRNFNLEIENINDWTFILCCDGINYESNVSINGSFIVKHEGGFSGFSSIIPNGLLKESENTIEIIVSNVLDKSKTLPLRNLPVYPDNYGGIYRDIYIIAVPKLFIKSINVSNEIDINYNSDIRNVITVSSNDLTGINLPADRKVFIQSEIVDSGGTVKASSNPVALIVNSNSTQQVINNFSFPDARYWSPDNSYLYKIRVRIITEDKNIIDEFIDDLGVYEFILKANILSLNKVDFRFKGIVYTEEMMGYGTAMTYEAIEKDVLNIKSMGFNTIRLFGKPASPYLMKLCNRYGLFLLLEIPVVCLPVNLINDEDILSLAENQLTEIINTSKNNPSVIGYGLGSYLDFSSNNTKEYLQRISATAKKEDKRLTYYCTNNIKKDICKDIVDLVGLNLLETDVKWLKDFLSDSKFKKDKYFISDYGRIINPVNTGGYSDPVSLEHQAKLIADVNKLIKNSPISGAFFFSYADWFADYPLIKHFTPNGFIKTTGLFGAGREQRPPAVIMRKINFDEDLPNFNIGTYTREAPIIFIFAGIGLFLIFIYIANSIRRFRENIWRALFRPFIFFTDVREQNLIATWYNLLLAVILSIGNSLFFSSLIYFWKDNPDFDIIISALISSETMKLYFTYAASNPVMLTALLSVIIFLKLFLISFIVWLFSLTLKFRVPYNNIYTVTVWSFLPTLLLMIFGVFYYRILSENTDFIIIGLVIAAAIFVISLYRIIKGANIVFDSPMIKTYFYGILTITVIAGGFWLYLNNTKFILNYIDLVLSFVKI